MKQYGVRVAAGVLAVVVTFTGLNIDVQAAGVSSVLPAGGVNLALVKDTSLESLQDGSKGLTAKIESAVSLNDVPQTAAATAAINRVKEEEGFKNLVIAQVDKYVNIRSTASEDGEVVGKLYDDSVGTFISEENGWYQITSGNVTGYVKAEYCVTGDAAVELAKQVGTRIATVNTKTLYVRTEPTTDSSVLGMVPMDDDLIVLEETDLWAKVNIEEGDGWVSKEYVTLNTEFVKAESKEEEERRLAKEAEERRKAQQAAQKAVSQSSGNSGSSSNKPSSNATVGEGSDLGVAVAEYAIQFEGNPYVYGGTSLTNGADCSGFVMSVYANFGVSLPHSSSADRTQGSAVDGLDNAQPGDLICYSGHVALYIGNGKIVHASTKKTGIVIGNADYKRILAIRRIF